MMILLMILVLDWTELVSALQECAPLMWHEKHFLYQSLGYDIQVCCNVTSLWAAELRSGWKLDTPAFNNVPLTELSLPGSEFVISKCEARDQIIQGYVTESRGKPCTQHTGHILRISLTSKLTMDRWYIWCYVSSGCRICSLQLFCSDHYSMSCTSRWIQRSVVNVTNSSLAVLVKFGEDLPFPAATLKISVQNNERYMYGSSVIRDKESDTSSQEMYNTSVTSVPGTETSISVGDLEPSTWYRIKTCLIFTPPASFLQQNDLRGSSLNELCLTDESYRTLSNSAVGVPLFSLPLIAVVIFIIHYFHDCFVTIRNV